MDTKPLQFTPKKGSLRGSGGTYYVSSKKSSNRSRDELVDVNFYNENAEPVRNKRKMLWIPFVLLLLAVAALTYWCILPIFLVSFEDSVRNACPNATEESITDFANFAEKYDKIKTYNDSGILCMKLGTFISTQEKYKDVIEPRNNEAAFGITNFADWNADERYNFMNTNLTEIKPVEAPMVLHNSMFAENDTWNVNNMARQIVFNNSASREVNMMSGLAQWFKLHPKKATLQGKKRHFNEKSVLERISANRGDTVSNELTVREGTIYFDTFGPFATQIAVAVPDDIYDYQGGVVTLEQCRDAQSTFAKVDAIIVGYGKYDANHTFWEIQPIGEEWRDWGEGGTMRADTSKECLNFGEIFSVAAP